MIATCDTCGDKTDITKVQQVHGGICICDKCVPKILSLYVAENPIKTLCPKCHGKENNKERCPQCDLPDQILGSLNGAD